MKLLLVALNRETHPYPVQPIGMTYIAAAARLAGHEVAVLDTNLREDPLADLDQTIETYAPEVIGLSLRNIDNCAFPRLEFYLPWAREVVDRCRRASFARLLIGGSGFSVMPKEILEYLDLEIGVLGEGEKSVCELLEAWQRGVAPDNVEGLARRTSKEYRETSSTPLPFRDQAILPARDFLDMPAYLRKGSLTAVQTKRGCALRCIYCTYPLLEGRSLRMRVPERVGEELEGLQRDYGVEEVFFTDNVFNNPPEHAVAICREIIRRGLRLSWTGFFHPAFMTEELAEWAVRSGCAGVEFGTEGGSATSLRALRKGFTVETLVRSHRIAQAACLKTCHYLIVGSPGETPEIVREGLDLVSSLDPTAVLVSTGIRIYPKTEMAEMARREGYDTANLLIPQFYFPSFMREDPAGVIAELAKAYPRFRFEGFHPRHTIELLEALRRRGHRGPTWRIQEILRGVMDQPAPVKPSA
jgi:radical SAM superfamily enzyme YgiQ (UPF0313 family)